MRELKKAGKRTLNNEEWERQISSGWRPEKLAGYRYWSNGQYYLQGTYGYYWSSSPTTTYSYYAYFSAGGGGIANGNIRGYGFSCRCIKELGKEEDEPSEEVEREESNSSSSSSLSEIIQKLQELKTTKQEEIVKIDEAITLISNL